MSAPSPSNVSSTLDWNSPSRRAGDLIRPHRPRYLHPPAVHVYADRAEPEGPAPGHRRLADHSQADDRHVLARRGLPCPERDVRDAQQVQHHSLLGGYAVRQLEHVGSAELRRTPCASRSERRARRPRNPRHQRPPRRSPPPLSSRSPWARRGTAFPRAASCPRRPRGSSDKRVISVPVLIAVTIALASTPSRGHSGIGTSSNSTCLGPVTTSRFMPSSPRRRRGPCRR